MVGKGEGGGERLVSQLSHRCQDEHGPNGVKMGRKWVGVEGGC